MIERDELICAIARSLYARAAWIDHSSTAKAAERDEHNRRQAAECVRAASLLADVLDPPRAQEETQPTKGQTP